MKINEARMRYPLLDGAIIFSKIAIVAAVAIRALMGCGGAAFTAGDFTDAASSDARFNVPDGADAADARDDLGNIADAVGDKGDATPFQDAGQEASSLQDAPTIVETGPACCSAPTAACSYPLASCPIASENHGSYPSYFEEITYPQESCATIATPPACLCNYTCACVTNLYHCSSGTESCTSDPIQGILVTCTN